MKATRIARWGLLPLVVAAAGLLTPATVSAQEMWTYTCQESGILSEGTLAALDCTASNGAPETGEITQPFLVQSRNQVTCMGGGTSRASLPDFVRGTGCQ
ncbi:hypothetical protein [Nocardia sp. R6R-6]|uniref:hypothetical protein n=1 Tax=Nocardia sp. R6R-6 TaxID=3459303 RepID=UPI00403D5CEB